MELPYSQKINSLSKTESISVEIAKYLKVGNIVALEGNLGSGKTTLVKNICMNYNIENVTSPSFSIVNEYEGLHKIYHFDFYRINKIEELYDLGIDDYLNDEAIVFIEWANLFIDILPQRFIKIILKLHENGEREILINKVN